MINEPATIMSAATATVFTYLDPGAGSMLLSAIIGVVATLFFVVRSIYFKLAQLPRFLSYRKQTKHNTADIVFYSEGGRYWGVFAPVLDELSQRGIRCTYLSSDSNDPGLSTNLPNVEGRCIGEGYKAFFTLNTLRADVFVATTPGLDVLQLKRSKGVGTYCHITHSAGGCAGYSTFGIDYYDMVLVGGYGDKQMIEEIERARNLKPKKLEMVGCTYLDTYRVQLKTMDKAPFFSDSTDSTILISPTWGKHGLLNRIGDRLLATLVNADCFNIIVRPHPQSLVSESALIESLTAKYGDSPRVVFDKADSGLQAMSQTDVMISDFSGIIFDFLFLFEKPILAFNAHYDKRGKDAMDLADDPWNIRTLKKLKGSINDDDIESIPDRIQLLVSRDVSFSQLLMELKQDMDKYPGESGKRCADAILTVCKSSDNKENR